MVIHINPFKVYLVAAWEKKKNKFRIAGTGESFKISLSFYKFYGAGHRHLILLFSPPKIGISV